MNIPDDMYRQLYKAMPRQLAFKPERMEDFNGWSEAVRRKLRELLRLDPAPGMARAETVEQVVRDGLVREKVLIHDPLFGPIPVFILTTAGQREPAPGIICLHGHGGYFAGKDMVVDNPDAPPIARECAAALNYPYGMQLARAGFVTASPDAWNFGERMFERDRQSQNHVCDHYLAGLSAFGFSAAGVTTRGNILVLEYLRGRRDVAPAQTGCVGLSYGGFQTLLLAAVDPRITCAVISGATYSYEGELARDAVCGAQVIPNALDWFDLPDLAASLAPRPILCEMMKKDGCFNFETSWRLYCRLQAVYKRLGAGDKIDSDTADTDHRYIGLKVPDFFRKHLHAG